MYRFIVGLPTDVSYEEDRAYILKGLEGFSQNDI